MSRYSKEHHEDVAKVLKENRAWAIKLDSPHARGVMAATIGTFADLFAADNPGKCSIHGSAGGEWNVGCTPVPGSGFDREKFLAACGLETKRCQVGSHDGPCTSACLVVVKGVS